MSRRYFKKRNDHPASFVPKKQQMHADEVAPVEPTKRDDVDGSDEGRGEVVGRRVHDE